MHTITKYGPLCDRDEYGRHVDEFKWNRDTPRPLTPTAKIDPEANIFRTCETLWVSDSLSGDYYDNMNSIMFMQWVKNHLLPTFKNIIQIRK